MSKKENVLGYPLNFFKINNIIMILSGTWCPDSKFPKYRKSLYFLYCFAFHSLGGTFFICEVLQLSETLQSPKKLVAHIGMLVTHCMGIFKIGILVFRRKKIGQVMRKLHDSRYYYNAFGNCNPGKIMLREQKISSMAAVGTFVLYSFVGISAHLSSISTLNEEIETDYFREGQSCYNYLRYYFYIPFPTNTRSSCLLALTYMDIGLGIFGWTIACYDGVFVGLVNCLKAHLIILSEVFKTSGKRIKVSKHDLLEDTTCIEEQHDKRLTLSIQHLQMLLRIQNDLEDITALASLAQTLSSLLVIGSTLYAASTVPVISSEFFAQIEYLFCLLLQLFLLCFYGNGITSACDQMRICLYQCNWYTQRKSFKYKVAMTLMRLQKPVYLSIGKFSPLNLATFLAVCKGSFSYFTLFKSLKT